jgi:hypothetical protein
VNQIQLTLIIGYLLMTCYFLSNWLIFSLRHPTSAPEDQFLSFVMFLVTTIFWPLMIIMSCLETLKNKTIDISRVIPVLLAIFVFSTYYYLTYLYEHGFCPDLLCNYSVSHNSSVHLIKFRG